MKRISFLIQVKPGTEKEYERRHNPVWPELAEIYKAHGVHNFSIFLHQSTGYLFGYFEAEDEALLSQLEHNSVCKKWWKYMAEILVCPPDNNEKGKEEFLSEVFHLP